jgi:hypothetical protein
MAGMKGDAMQTCATRLIACAAIALTAVAVIAAPVVPAVHEGLADAVSLCTPPEVPCPPQTAVLRVPRCGVA